MMGKTRRARANGRQLASSSLVAAMIAVALCVLAPSSAAAAACPNEAFRAGPSAQLPDCRAFELVTPADSNGRTFGVLPKEGEDLFPTELAGHSGNSLVFSTTAGPLASPPGANGQQELNGYEARRNASGWLVPRRVTPSGAETVLPWVGGLTANHEYVFAFVRPGFPSPGKEFGSLFRFDPTYKWGAGDFLGDGEGHFEPTGVGSMDTEKLAQGRYISPGGGHVIFSTGKETGGSEWCEVAVNWSGLCPVRKLEPNAPPEGTGAIYDRAADGPTQVVSLLPGDVTPGAGEDAAYQGVSADGAVVAFKVGGTLYVRIDNTTTEKVTEAASTFGGLSADGRYLFYVSAGDIHRFDTETKADVKANSSGDGEMVNVSADGSHLYFISKSQLDGGEGTAGQPNLYVWSGGSPNFIATVLEGDLAEPNFGLAKWTVAVAPGPGEERGPGFESSRTTPNGSAIIFTSRAQLTPPFNNEGHIEIYHYEAAGESVDCVSCNPEGTLASVPSDARLENPRVVHPMDVIHNLSEDGKRVFFETEETLIEADEDEVNDVYEWQLPTGGGEPEVDLISSGQTAKRFELSIIDPNVLLGITPDGSDVFFRSEDALAPGAGEGGVQAIYDARVGGGFPQPPPPPPPCEEEGCRPAPTAPPNLGAASSSLRGAGNVVAKKQHKRRRCQSKKHKKGCPHKRAQRAAQPKEASAQSAEPSVPALSRRAATNPLTAAGPLLSGTEFDYFGIESVKGEDASAQAGAHPDVTTKVALNPPLGPTNSTISSAKAEDVAVELPLGLVGNPNLAPRCETGEFIAGECPLESQVGFGRAKLPEGFEPSSPLFNLAPPHPEEEIARFGLSLLRFWVFIDVSVRTAGDYGVTATVHDASGAEPLEESEVTIWGDPADPSHDSERVPPGPSGSEPIGFMTNPSACQSQQLGLSVTSYQLPGQIFSKSGPMDPITECEGLSFEPSFEAHPTSRVAGAPTGLQTSFELPQSSDPDVLGTATMREARVTLPVGMAISASAGDGLAACSDEEVGFHEEVDAQCPDASKLGSATISSPALPRPLEGVLYLRSQGDKRHRFRLWLVSDDLGLHIKLPAEIQPDPATGQLTAVFSDLPQVPVEAIDFDIWGGPRAPLKNPDSCGTYQTSYTFTPHSNDPPVSSQSAMTIDEGCGARGFNPQLHAGTTNPTAGAFSSFVLDLAREDGQQDLAGFEATLPPGLLAKLKGVGVCPEGATAAGACPPDSRVGTLIAASGAGPDPLWIPQPGKEQPSIYLAGPYKAAPYSFVSVVPAQVGPFDLGEVVVRAALAVDPETAIATVKTDPLPQFIEGIPVLYRRLHAIVNRPEFTLNPTDCSELAITSNVASTEGTVAHPSDRFEVDGCGALGFKPKLSLKLRGGSERGDYPALQAILKTRKGDANLAAVSVALPHSEFVALEHIQTICTRVRFAAHTCPKGSVYGKAKAFTPLLDHPLEGPVYLRSSSHPLPDLVVDLKGQIEVAVAGRIDSKHGGIRARFEAIPDAPVSRFVLQMKGGAKGLLTNSTDICAHKHRASVRMGAQNGRAASLRPALGVRCGKELSDS
jgi:WD40-like Beta Propeller Repeat